MVLPSFIGLAYPYILLVNLIFMSFWILRRKKEFLISLVAILLGWHTLMDNISIHPGALFQKAHYEKRSREERIQDRQIKIMSYNVRAFDLYGWTGIPGAKPGIFNMIQKENPEILCLQEFYSSSGGEFRADEIYRKLEGTKNRYLAFSVSNTRNQYGIAIFSDFPIISEGKVELDNSLSICQFTDLLVLSDTIRVYNMHLQSIHLRKHHYNFIDSLKLRYDNQQMDEIKDISSKLRDAFKKRAGQADLIAEHIDKCPYPVIVCGDFNDTPVSYTYRRIKGDRTDAFVEQGIGMGRTYNGKFPSFRIDYIIFGKEFEALHFSRKKTGFSDHYPVIGILQLP